MTNDTLVATSQPSVDTVAPPPVDPLKEETMHTAITDDSLSSTGSDSSAFEEDRARSVSFSTIEIREYPRTLGDHPAVTGGAPPLSIEWDHVHQWILQLDEYEAASTGPSRCSSELQLPASVRWEIVREE